MPETASGPVAEFFVGSRRIEHIESLTQFTMEIIHEIRIKFEKRQYEFSKHAVDQSVIRDISVAELEDAIANKSEVIEDYPDDKYGPSCLVFGYTKASRPLHVHCSYPSRPLVKIITLYEPDPDLWVDFRVRR